MMSHFATIDLCLQKSLGLPYLRLTREDSIHERLHYLVQVVNESTIDDRPARVLDAGCGSELALYYLSRFCPKKVSSYTGIDLHTGRLSDRYSDIPLRHNFHDVNLDDDWDFGHFDLIWCSETLEHLVDDAGVFRKLCRSARFGGRIIVTMPSLSHLRIMGRHLSELLAVSGSQDGGHVGVGYDEESLLRLRTGTNARLLRIDCISKSGLHYLKRRYLWPFWLQPINTALNTLSRDKADAFVLGGKEFCDAFFSIAAVYEIQTRAGA